MNTAAIHVNPRVVRLIAALSIALAAGAADQTQYWPDKPSNGGPGIYLDWFGVGAYPACRSPFALYYFEDIDDSYGVPNAPQYEETYTCYLAVYYPGSGFGNWYRYGHSTMGSTGYFAYGYLWAQAKTYAGFSRYAPSASIESGLNGGFAAGNTTCQPEWISTADSPPLVAIPVGTPVSGPCPNR